MEKEKIYELLRGRGGDESAVSDVETLYEIIVETRRERGSQGEFDELIALAALCRITWPGKLPTYPKAVKLVQMKFQGISNDPQLAHRFRYGLSPRLIRAVRKGDIRFKSLADLFTGDLPRR